MHLCRAITGDIINVLLTFSNVSTLNYSVKALDKLNESFNVIHFIPGNHDEYHRDKRDYNSIAFIKKYQLQTVLFTILQLEGYL